MAEVPVELLKPSMQVAQGAYYSVVASGGLVLLPLVLLTFILSTRPLSGRIPVINLMIGLCVYALGDVMLPLSGHISDPSPTRNLCLAQLGLIYGGLIMASAAGVTLMLQLLLTLPVLGDTRKPCRLSVKLAIFLTPPICLFLYLIVQVAVAVTDPQILVLGRGNLVCRFEERSPFFFRKGLLIILAVAFSLMVIISIYIWVRVRPVLKRNAPLQRKHASDLEQISWVSILLRVVIFEATLVVGAVLIITDSITRDRKVHTLAVAFGGLVPLIAFVIFGTVENVRRAWFGWCFTIREHNQAKDVEKA